jgi:hypothetical protein
LQPAPLHPHLSLSPRHGRSKTKEGKPAGDDSRVADLAIKGGKLTMMG